METITRDLLVKRCNEEEAKMKKLVEEYNALDQDETPKSELDEKMAAIEEAVDNYNNSMWVLAVADIKAAGEPVDRMKKAVETFSYPVVKAREKNIGEKEAPVMILELVGGSKKINLASLHKTIKGGIGNDAKWLGMVQKFNMLMTARVATDIKSSSPAEARKIASIIKETFDIPAEAKGLDVELSVSGNKMIKAVQTVVDSMLGEGYKVTSHDVRFIEWRYGKKSRNKNTVKCSSNSEIAECFMNVCNKLYTGSTYEAEYKIAKQK